MKTEKNVILAENPSYIIEVREKQRKVREGWNVTQLELIAAIGNGSMEVAAMYFKGQLTLKELQSVLGERNGEIVEEYVKDYVRERGQAIVETACTSCAAGIPAGAARFAGAAAESSCFAGVRPSHPALPRPARKPLT